MWGVCESVWWGSVSSISSYFGPGPWSLCTSASIQCNFIHTASVSQDVLLETEPAPRRGSAVFVVFLFSPPKVKFHTSPVITTIVMFKTTNKHRCVLLISFVKCITSLESFVFVNFIKFPPALSLCLLFFMYAPNH